MRTEHMPSREAKLDRREMVLNDRLGDHDIVIDLQSHEVVRDGSFVQLTPLEFRILYLLALNAGRVIPHARLVEYAWGYDGGDSNLLKTHICHIRKKLALPPGQQGGIRAIPGVGYSLAQPSPEHSSQRRAEAVG